MKPVQKEDTICAPATAPGIAAISVIRLSGKSAFDIMEPLFVGSSRSKRFKEVKPHQVTLGEIMDDGKAVDEVLLTKFVSPKSYTGEDLVEISCHGSPYITQRIIQLLVDNGARMARPGEFTMRAFLNGHMDLSQAEGVADLISSNSEASHTMAFRQMRGHFSELIRNLREQLLKFASLIELELDFSEEDVEFANRDELLELLDNIIDQTTRLKTSFSLGNVIKTGIPVAIIGKPNVGKSTLLNAILNEERAIVSEIPGTTRDTIEDTLVINGVQFRFIDTAGLRESLDVIESVGIERTYQKIKQASVILYMFDASETTIGEILETVEEFRSKVRHDSQRLILIANKIDLMEEMPHHFNNLVELETIFVSAKRKENINLITDSLLESAHSALEEENQYVVTNARHYEALSKTAQAVSSVKEGLQSGIPGDLLASELRQAIHHLGTITGEITTDEILGNIFGKFCIGK